MEVTNFFLQTVAPGQVVRIYARVDCSGQTAVDPTLGRIAKGKELPSSIPNKTNVNPVFVLIRYASREMIDFPMTFHFNP